jgi:long-chain fatty acid transport protein
MRSTPFAILGLVVMIVAAMCGAALATNGYFSHGVGMKAKAVGGASVAWPQDAMSGANNPAAPGFLGNRFDVGLDLFRPNRGSEIADNAMGEMVNGEYDANDRMNFLIPEIGYNNHYRDNMAVGFALFGRGGMNTTYTTPVPLLGGTNAGVDLMQMFLVPYVAYKVNENHSIGFGLNFAWQAFEATGLEGFAAVDTLVAGEDTTITGRYSSDPENLTNRGHESSMGLGFSIGYMGRVHEMVDVGVTYQSRTYMGKFKMYQGLFAEMGNFDIPPSLAAGITVRANEKTTVAFDVQHIWYSNIKSINNPLLPNFGQAKLGEDGGAGFGWEDVTAFKLGLAYDVHQKVRLLGGYNYGKQPIPESETLFNILAPGVVENHLTLGTTVVAGAKTEITFAYMHAFEKKVDGSASIPGGMPPGGFGGGESNLRMSQNSFGLAVGWSF